ncbi:MAG: hypothetical protein GWP04_00300 [Gammaproteobacteria bacterium]|nr:hypothetical protein [Gammaproteobacteria bacterium]
MPPPLPDRYRLEQRLGRDGDVEEWLATDTLLDRPVLIRALGPETTSRRREQFVTSLQGVAGVSHMHLANVYSAAQVEGGAYSVTEWTGGITMQDRLSGGETMTPEEFITNAAGLAGALAAMHQASVLHGMIDPSAIRFSKAHPAKLGAFGRLPTSTDAASDVTALADTLQICLTGDPGTFTAPSQLVDGISVTVDEALAEARSGDLDARGLAEALQAAPNAPKAPERSSGWTWRWLTPAFLLLVLAAGLVTLGLLLSSGSDSPALFPARPPTSTTPATILPPMTTTSTTAPRSTSAVSIGETMVLDPYGDNAEHDAKLPLLTDGDITTSWRTERYYDPLPLIKQGVGIVFAVTGTPTTFRAKAMSNGTTYSLLWAQEMPAEFAGWARIAGGTVAGGSISLQLPRRDGGFWLLWLTDLPQQDDGYFTSIGEIEFSS